jgi:hypothetical protein
MVGCQDRLFGTSTAEKNTMTNEDRNRDQQGPEVEENSSKIILALPKTAIRELIKEILEETLIVLSWPAGRVALNETEAAETCGLNRTTLRDLRLAGKVKASKVGKRWVYTRDDLLRALKTHENLEISDSAGSSPNKQPDPAFEVCRNPKSAGPFPRIRPR